MKRYYSKVLMTKFSCERIIFLIAQNDIFQPILFSLYDTNNDEIEHDKSNHKKVSKY